MPIPTRGALWAFIGCIGLLALGLLGRSPVLIVFAGSGLLGLATALVWTLPLANRMRRQRVEFAWWHGHGAHERTEVVTAGAPYVIRCYIRSRAAEDYRLRELRPSLPPGTRCVKGAGSDLPLPGGSRAEFSLTFLSDATGRMVAQGLALRVPGPLSLFEAPLYFPTPLTVKVLPRGAAGKRSRALSVSGLPVERPGQTLMRESGGGTELRELRELQPGDPYKSIAWKPSARRGKLLVREVEREVQETLCMVLDVSGSMRGGEPGGRKLDLALEFASLKAYEALEHGDRVGLWTVDGRVLSHAAPGEGRMHMLRIYDTLLRATDVVDADLTSIDDDELVRAVAHYMQHQDGLRLAGDAVYADDLAFHARRTLRREMEAEDVIAETPALATLRRYCKQRGIQLPYRTRAPGDAKATGLATALRQAGGDSRVPRSIVVVSDLDGVADLQPLVPVLRMLRRQRHAVVFVWPDPRRHRRHGARAATEAEAEAEADPAASLRGALEHAYGLQEARRLDGARRALARLGVPVVAMAADDPTAVIVHRVRALVQAA